MIVTALVAAAAAMSWPAARRSLARNDRAEAVRQITDFVKQTRQRALEKSETLILRFKPRAGEIVRWKVHFDEAPVDALGSNTTRRSPRPTGPQTDLPQFDGPTPSGRLGESELPVVADDPVFGSALERLNAVRIPPGFTLLTRNWHEAVYDDRRMAFDPTGQCDSAGFELHGYDGFLTPLWIDGGAGAIHVGERKRIRRASDQSSPSEENL